MATENTLMAAALTQGTTTIRNAASEPHVQNLARLLVKMGARIDGIGSNVLDRARPRRLRGAQIDVAPDHIEVGELHGARGGHRRRDADQGHRAGRPQDDPHGVRAARPEVAPRLAPT